MTEIPLNPVCSFEGKIVDTNRVLVKCGDFVLERTCYDAVRLLGEKSAVAEMILKELKKKEEGKASEGKKKEEVAEETEEEPFNIEESITEEEYQASRRKRSEEAIDEKLLEQGSKLLGAKAYFGGSVRTSEAELLREEEAELASRVEAIKEEVREERQKRLEESQRRKKEAEEKQIKKALERRAEQQAEDRRRREMTDKVVEEGIQFNSSARTMKVMSELPKERTVQFSEDTKKEDKPAGEGKEEEGQGKPMSLFKQRMLGKS